MTERWKPVPTWEGLYEVSDHGQVRSRGRISRGRNGSPRPIKGRILKEKVNKATGYVQVCLSDLSNGRQEYRYVHDLVLTAFLGSRPEGYDACHWDGNSSNNCLSNLRWDSRKSNMADKERHGTRSPVRKLDPTRAKAVRVMLSSGLRPETVASVFGVSVSNIRQVRNNVTWKGVT